MEDMDDIMAQLNNLKLEDNPENPEADLTEKLAQLSVDDSPFKGTTQEIIQKVSSCEGVQNIVEGLLSSDLTSIPCRDLCILYTTEEEKLILISLIGSGQLLTTPNSPLEKMIDWNLINLLLNLLKNAEDVSIKIEITKAFSALFKNNECALEMLLIEGFGEPVLENCKSNIDSLQIESFQILYDIAQLNERYISFLFNTGGYDVIKNCLLNSTIDSPLQELTSRFLKDMIPHIPSPNTEDTNLLIEQIGLILGDNTSAEIQLNLIRALSELFEYDFTYNIFVFDCVRPMLNSCEMIGNEHIKSEVANAIQKLSEKEEHDQGIVQSGLLGQYEAVFSQQGEQGQYEFIRLLGINMFKSQETMAELEPTFLAVISGGEHYSQTVMSMMIEILSFYLERIEISLVSEKIDLKLLPFLVINLFKFGNSQRIFQKLELSVKKLLTIMGEVHGDEKASEIYQEVAQFILDQRDTENIVDTTKLGNPEEIPVVKSFIEHISYTLG